MTKLKITFDREPAKAASESSSAHLLIFPLQQPKKKTWTHQP